MATSTKWLNYTRRPCKAPLLAPRPFSHGLLWLGSCLGQSSRFQSAAALLLHTSLIWHASATESVQTSDPAQVKRFTMAINLSIVHVCCLFKSDLSSRRQRSFSIVQGASPSDSKQAYSWLLGTLVLWLHDAPYSSSLRGQRLVPTLSRPSNV